MKKTAFPILLLFLFLSTLSFGQDPKTERVHELGVTFSNLNAFGINYKCGTGKTLLRLTALYLNLGANNEWGRTEDSIDRKQTKAGFGIRVGFEKRIAVASRFNLHLGSDLSVSYNYDKINDQNASNFYEYQSTQWSVTPGISFIFGAGYQIGTNLIISAEIAPSLTYTYGKRDNNAYNLETITTLNNFAFGLGTNAASISIAYRFAK